MSKEGLTPSSLQVQGHRMAASLFLVLSSLK